jgi:hypothetical protein
MIVQLHFDSILGGFMLSDDLVISGAECTVTGSLVMTCTSAVSVMLSRSNLFLGMLRFAVRL